MDSRDSRYSNIDADQYSNCNSHDNADSYADPDRDTIGNSDLDKNSDGNAFIHAHSYDHANSDEDRDGYANSDQDRNENADLDADSMSNEPIKRILILGAGSRHFDLAGGWEAIRVDNNPAHHPDLLWNLEDVPLPFEDNSFDQIAAVEVLEHLRTQGDCEGFFADFSEYYRLLKADGLFVATVPMWNSEWAWGDPSHKRVISKGSLVFLDQAQYTEQIGNTPMSDFRSIYRADFETMEMESTEHTFKFTLRAIKPARIQEGR